MRQKSSLYYFATIAMAMLWRRLCRARCLAALRRRSAGAGETASQMLAAALTVQRCHHRCRAQSPAQEAARSSLQEAVSGAALDSHIPAGALVERASIMGTKGWWTSRASKSKGCPVELASLGWPEEEERGAAVNPAPSSHRAAKSRRTRVVLAAALADQRRHQAAAPGDQQQYTATAAESWAHLSPTPPGEGRGDTRPPVCQQREARVGTQASTAGQKQCSADSASTAPTRAPVPTSPSSQGSPPDHQAVGSRLWW